MPDPSLPAWWRMLSWGLFASLVLHWVAFDVMRAAAWLPSMSANARLQVSLPAPRSDAAPNVLSPDVPQDGRHNVGHPKAAPALPAALPRSPSAPDLRAPEKALAAPKDGVANEIAAQPLPESARAAELLVEGLRSGQPAEAMTGLRLALAQRLGKVSPALLLAAGVPRVLIWCDFDAAGRLLEVRSAAGVLDAALQASMRQALGQLVLPTALIGKAFALDVLLESGD